MVKKIAWMYPGAWKFQPEPRNFDLKSKTISLVHLGTLYGSRNMDNLFTAIENIEFNKQLQGKEFKVTNMGAMYLENNEVYFAKHYFTQFTEVGRTEALQIAVKADFLLLLQHQDDRSLETIPYKTYDYLNLELPILGVTNNPELDELIQNYGGIVADANSVSSIENALIKLISGPKNPKQENSWQVLDIKQQFIKLLNLEVPK
jgi:glycosyltransferase involved in cell wall biosynthesis